MRLFCTIQLLMSVFWTAFAYAQTPARAPHIGYLYPAGGRVGTEFEIAVGGQFLRGATEVLVSGKGICATVIEHVPPLRPLDKEQRQELRQRVRAAAEKQLAALPAKTRKEVLRWREFSGKGQKKPAMMMETMEEMTPSKLPDYPLFRDLEEKSLRELRHLVTTLFDRSKKQRNAQLADMVLVKVSIDTDAKTGDRELRVRTSQGLTNPMCFQIGRLPEVREHEPNEPKEFRLLPGEEPVDVPAVLNGQIMPGDVDRFRFRATKGQKLAIIAQARHLIPFLADAVPGWFQATLALYAADGDKLAFSDDYRIAISEQPFITSAFPLGGQLGKETVASITGWNVPTGTLKLDTSPGPDGIRHAALPDAPGANEIAYAVDTLPDIPEREPNNTLTAAQDVVLPGVVNGRIEAPGDVDVFRFRAKAGDEIVADVLARRLGSPMDSLLRLMDENGKILAWNDDHIDKQGHLHRDMGAPAGFKLAGGRIPAGCDMIRVTLTAPNKPSGHSEELHVQGTASQDGQTVCRKAIPSDNVMQAFLWRHLAPSKALMVMVTGRRGWGWPVKTIGDGPIQLAPNGTTHVRLQGPKHLGKRKLELKLSQPPPGISLDAFSLTPGFINLDLTTDAKTTKPGLVGNLIIEVFTEVTPRKKGDAKAKPKAKAPEKKRRISLGVLPAIPFEIAAQ